MQPQIINRIMELHRLQTAILELAMKRIEFLRMCLTYSLVMTKDLITVQKVQTILLLISMQETLMMRETPPSQQVDKTSIKILRQLIKLKIIELIRERLTKILMDQTMLARFRLMRKNWNLTSQYFRETLRESRLKRQRNRIVSQLVVLMWLVWHALLGKIAYKPNLRIT